MRRGGLGNIKGKINWKKGRGRLKEEKLWTV